MKYYYDLMSQPSRAVYIFLNKNKIIYEKCPIALRKAENKTPEFKAINPFKLVPAIDDDGFKLGESVAILRYFTKKYEGQIGDHWYPKDIKVQAKVDQYMEWQHINTRANLAMFFQHKLLIPLRTNSPPNEKKIADFQKRMEKTLFQFENIWLKDSDYIAGSNISLADLLAICELQQPGIVGYNVCEGRPKLSSWFERVRNYLQPEFDEASFMVTKVTEMYAAGNMLPKPKL